MSESAKPAIIGYDARTVSSAWKALWAEQDRRDRFLIRTDVDTPRSVDTLVWPSLFDWRAGIGLARAERSRLLLDGLPAAVNEARFPWPLWDDASSLAASLAQPLRPEFLPYQLIAVADPNLDASEIGDAGMNFLGYDVADESLLSGLVNCGYDEEVRLPVRSEWADKLNQSHLFDNIADADRFRRFSDVRVPEHAPFRVYSLFESGPKDRIENARDSSSSGS